MTNEQKEVLLIFLPSVIHWFCYHVLLGVLYVFFEVSALILIPLLVIGIFVLPPIFKIVKKGEEDDYE